MATAAGVPTDPGAMEKLATLTLSFGMLVFLLGSFGFIVAAFRENLGWGIAVLFVPVAHLLFLVLHWRLTKGTFFLQLWGVAIIFVAVLMSPDHFDQLLGSHH